MYYCAFLSACLTSDFISWIYSFTSGVVLAGVELACIVPTHLVFKVTKETPTSIWKACHTKLLRSSLIPFCFVNGLKVTGWFLYPQTSRGQLPVFLLHLRCLAVICDAQATTGKNTKCLRHLAVDGSWMTHAVIYWQKDNLCFCISGWFSYVFVPFLYFYILFSTVSCGFLGFY